MMQYIPAFESRFFESDELLATLIAVGSKATPKLLRARWVLQSCPDQDVVTS